jgi:hypothetical protein
MSTFEGESALSSFLDVAMAFSFFFHPTTLFGKPVNII